MDQILAKASNQVVSFAIRSGISLASGYAIKTVSKFLDDIPSDTANAAAAKARILAQRKRLLAHISVVSASIDLIRLAAARGNSCLDLALDLVADLNAEIDAFNSSVASISSTLSNSNQKDSVAKVEASMSALSASICSVAPLLNLAISTLGVSLSAPISLATVSPGRLLQACHFLLHSNSLDKPGNVGPVFDLVTYLVFYNPSRLKYIDHEVDVASCISWKETFARAHVRVAKVGPMEYSLVVRESFDDNRYHDPLDLPREKSFDLSSVLRLFFSGSGKLLSLDDRTSPVLIIKFTERGSEEWLALGQLHKGEFDDDLDLDLDQDLDHDENLDNDKNLGNEENLDRDLDLEFADAQTTSVPSTPRKDTPQPNLKKTESSTSLLLLEYILRLCRLQQVEGTTILQIKDEVLAHYLRDEPDEGWDAVPHKFVAPAPKTDSSRLTMDSNVHRLQTLKLDQ